MQIKAKLIATITIVTVISVLITTILIGRLAYNQGRDMLIKQIQNKLTVEKDNKRNEINKLFYTMQQQVTSFSNNYMTAEAMHDFSNGFNLYVAEVKSNNKSVYKSSVVKHYLEDFSALYARYNNGREYDAKNLLNVLNETTFALQYHYILKNPYEVNEKSLMDFANDNTSYSKAHKKFHPHIRAFQQRFGFHDVFLVDINNGNVVYSARKELDFTTSLIDGPYAKTAVGEVFRKSRAANNPEFFAISDFEPYLPSYHQQSSFISSPIFSQGEKIGVLIFQLSANIIDDIMTNKNNWQEIGMGITGESYLLGDDKYMRSNSRFFLENPEGYKTQLLSTGTDVKVIENINIFHTTIGIQPDVTMMISDNIKDGQNLVVYKDYRNVTVMGTSQPMHIAGLNWHIVSKIDLQEALMPVRALAKTILYKSIGVLFIGLSVSFFVGVFLIKNIASPIEHLSSSVRMLSKSQDLTKRINYQHNDELGEMTESINGLLDSFQNILQAAVNSQDKVQIAAERLMQMAGHKEIENHDDFQEASDDLNALSERLANLSKQFKV